MLHPLLPPDRAPRLRPRRPGPQLLLGAAPGVAGWGGGRCRAARPVSGSACLRRGAARAERGMRPPPTAGEVLLACLSPLRGWMSQTRRQSSSYVADRVLHSILLCYSVRDFAAPCFDGCSVNYNSVDLESVQPDRLPVKRELPIQSSCPEAAVNYASPSVLRP